MEKVIGFRVSEEQAKQLKLLAKSEHLKLSDIARRAIREYLERNSVK